MTEPDKPTESTPAAPAHQAPHKLGSEIKRAVRDAGLVVLFSASTGLTVNAARGDGIPVIADNPYDTLVPCPEPGGDVTAVSASDPGLRDPSTLVVDARSAAEYATWHFRGAVHAPFDWLAELDQLRPMIRGVAKQAASRQRVIVYGDGGDPDSGLECAKLLVAEGIKRVHYVTGGAPALPGRPPTPAEPKGAERP